MVSEKFCNFIKLQMLGGVKLNYVLQYLFQKNMYAALAPETVGS